jgi:asparagine synthase (glutamine-hydrolysing)
MAGIAGILQPGQHDRVATMLEAISHRGIYGKTILEHEGATIGIVWALHEETGVKEKLRKWTFTDGPGFGHKAEVELKNGSWQIRRDELGVAPMYYAYNDDGALCFASEVKALMIVSFEVHEVPPGTVIREGKHTKHFNLESKPAMSGTPETIASELLNTLSLAVSRRITSGTIGSWLSGGLDSSAMAALARPWLTRLHTFAGGLRNAPDLKFANDVARHIGSDHHEVIIDLEEMLRVLPLVIYHLESFDPLLVRSSIVNYLVAEEAAGYVGEVFSGEGGDEFFAGYHYLKTLPESELDGELIDITGRLHNTALQRVDRCATAHGLTAHVVFADPQLFEFALRIPVGLKLKDGIEKWILREALSGLLPEHILRRPKAKFWEGAGVESLISDYASSRITDSDFKAERILGNSWKINTKEELYYYRIFRDYFGKLHNPEWMGRTKMSPEAT